MRGFLIAFAIGCHPAPQQQPAPAPAPAPPANHGNGSIGSFSTGSGTGAGSQVAPAAECAKDRCGPVPGLMTKPCPDGSTGGPTGRCLEHADHTCGWELRACP
jgi:hypothetical protein